MIAANNKNRILALLILIGSLAPLAADAYLPALSLLTNYFDTSEQMLKFSVTAYFIGFAGAQIIFGPLSDAYGRKKVILLGIVIGGLGALLCFSATSIYHFLIGRFILGIGMASGIPVARAVLKDLFTGVELSKAASSINMVFALMPFITPLIGAYLVSLYEWQKVFQLVFILAVFIFILAFIFLPETHQDADPSILEYKTLSQVFISVIKDKQVFIYGFSTFCAFGCAVTYMVSAPFIFINTLGLSMIEFGWLAGFITASYVIGGLINNRLTQKVSLDSIILFAFIGMLMASFVLAISLALWGPKLVPLIICVFFLMLASRMVFPNALAGAFSSATKQVGIISSVYGAYHTLGAVIASGIMSLLHFETSVSMALVLIGFSSLGLISFTLSRGISIFR